MGKLFVTLDEKRNLRHRQPTDIRNWHRKYNKNLVQREFSFERLLCRSQAKPKAPALKIMHNTSKTSLACDCHHHENDFEIISDEDYIRMGLSPPQSAVQLIQEREGAEDGVIKVPSMIFIKPISDKCCVLGLMKFKTLPSGIFINSTKKFDESAQHLTIPCPVPSSASPVIHHAIKRILVTRQHKTSSRFFYNLGALKYLNQNVSLQLGCLTTLPMFGSFNRTDEIFPAKSRGKQGLHCAYVALVHAQLVALDKWTPRILDDILTLADGIYRENREMEFIMAHQHVIIKRSHPMVVGQLDATEDNILNVMQGLFVYFQKFNSGLFLSGDLYLLIWRQNGVFYVFDSAGRIPNLQRCNKTGFSSLVQLTCLSNVGAMILKASSLACSLHYAMIELSVAHRQVVTPKQAEHIINKLNGTVEYVWKLEEPSHPVINKRYDGAPTTDLETTSHLSLLNFNDAEFTTQEVVNKLFSEFLGDIINTNECERNVDNILGTIIDSAVNEVEAEANKILECPIVDNPKRDCDPERNWYKVMPNGAEIILSSSDLDFIQNRAMILMAAVAVSFKHEEVEAWSCQVIDYIIKTAIILEKTIELDPRETLNSKSLNLKLELGLERYNLNAIKECTGFESELHSIISDHFIMKCRHHVLIVSDSYGCVIFIGESHYYLFDGMFYNSIGLKKDPEDEQDNNRYCFLRFQNFKLLRKQLKLSFGPKDLLRFYRIEEIEEFNEPLDVPLAINSTCHYEQRNSDCLFKIQGSIALVCNFCVMPSYTNQCYFTSIYALLLATKIAVDKWTPKMIDDVIVNGIELYSKHARYMGTKLYKQREITKILIDGYYYSILVKEQRAANRRDNIAKELRMFFDKRQCLLLQFCNITFAIQKDYNYYHLFESYGTLLEDNDSDRSADSIDCRSARENGVEDLNTASWIRFSSLREIVTYTNSRLPKDCPYKSYRMSAINVTSVVASGGVMGVYLQSSPYPEIRIQSFDLQETLIPRLPKETPKWTETYCIPPWSRLLINETPNNFNRLQKANPGLKIDALHHDFEVLYPNDLYTLWGNIHPRSCKFEATRDKQHFAIGIICCFMVRLYSLDFWTPDIVDSVVIEGDEYFKDSIKHIKKLNYEITIDDMNPEIEIGAVKTKVKFCPIENGKLYMPGKNLSQALQSFFKSGNERGILVCNQKILTFGVDKKFGYFLFDSQSYGYPLFADDHGCAYILKCLTLKRLLFCIILTLMQSCPVVDFSIYAIHFDIKVDGYYFPRPKPPVKKVADNSKINVTTSVTESLITTDGRASINTKPEDDAKKSKWSWCSIS